VACPQDEFDDSMIKTCAARTIAAAGKSIPRSPAPIVRGPADSASDCAELARQPQRTAASIAAFFDDRQRAWRHLLHLRGELSTALVSARPGGENVAGCADPPSELKCRMEARRVDRETAESVAGLVRPLRRAAALVWVLADQEGPRSPPAVLIIFALLWMVSREPRLYPCMHRE
jgi:hypothetical protein